MRVLNLTPRGVACIMVAAASLAAALAFSVEGRLTGELTQASGPVGSDEVENSASTVEKCLPKGGDETGSLVLTAKKGGELKFTCDEKSSLSPPDAKFTKVYLYTEEKPGTCDTTKNVTLTSEVDGATLTQQEAVVSLFNKKSPVYLFQYNTEPEQDKYLCYTCNKTSASNVLESPLSGSVTPTNEVTCTVFIKVPKKNDPPTTDSSTATPGSTSSCRAMQAAAATAAGLLTAMLLV